MNEQEKNELKAVRETVADLVQNMESGAMQVGQAVTSSSEIMTTISRKINALENTIRNKKEQIEAQTKKSAGFGHKKEAIVGLQTATQELFTLQNDLFEAQALSFENQRLLGALSQGLITLGLINQANHDTMVEQIAKKLKGASKEELDDLARASLLKTLKELKERESERKKLRDLRDKVREQHVQLETQKQINRDVHVRLIEQTDKDNQQDAQLAARAEKDAEHDEQFRIQARKDMEHDRLLAEQAQKDAEHDQQFAIQAAKDMEHDRLLAEQAQKDAEHDEQFAIQARKDMEHDRLLAEQAHKDAEHDRLLLLLAERNEEQDEYMYTLNASLERHEQLIAGNAQNTEMLTQLTRSVHEKQNQAIEEWHTDSERIRRQAETAIAAVKAEIADLQAETKNCLERYRTDNEQMQQRVERTEASTKTWKIAAAVAAVAAVASLALNVLQMCGII